MGPEPWEKRVKFVPKRLEETADNSRGQETLKTLCRALLIVAVAAALVIGTAAFLLDRMATRLSDEAEQEYLGWISKHIPNMELEADSELTAKFERANAVLKKVMSVGYERTLPYELRMMSLDAPNAFAAPGGLIAVSPPLFDWVETEEGLAFVLAHELAHHEARHVGRRMLRGIFVIAIQLIVDSGLGQSSMDWIGDLAVAQYSQSQEYEADLLALKRLQKLYPDLTNATEFLERALEAEDGFPLGMGIWQTHPPTIERLERLRREIDVMRTQP